MGLPVLTFLEFPGISRRRLVVVFISGLHCARRAEPPSGGKEKLVPRPDAMREVRMLDMVYWQGQTPLGGVMRWSAGPPANTRLINTYWRGAGKIPLIIYLSILLE